MLLDAHSPCAPATPYVPLKKYQLRAVHAMAALEDHDQIRAGTVFYVGRTFVFADTRGGGKTLAMLALIASKPTVRPRAHVSWSQQELPCTRRPWSRTPSLIVVPHTLVHHWRQALASQTYAVSRLGHRRDLITRCMQTSWTWSCLPKFRAFTVMQPDLHWSGLL